MTGRQQLVRATIRSIWQETPTVKGLQLAVAPESALSFLPGQWVDFHAPGVPHVGGYSICSTPSQLASSATFDLAVKASRHPCAQWVHTQAAPGDQVEVQVGGTFTLAASSMQRCTLFVAGGIGITCLSSMLGHLVEAKEAAAAAAAQQQQQVPAPLLLLSSSSPQEFALLPRLLRWHQQGLLQLQLYTTQSHALSDELQQAGVACRPGRIAAPQLQQALQSLGAAADDMDIYVCGPPAMTDDVVGQLEQLGVPASSIRTEKWW